MLRLLRQFRDSEEGSVFVLVAVTSLMLVIAAGAAIDMARAQTLQAKLSASLDAAGLAAGATANSVDPTTQAQRYFNANFPAGYLGAGTITLGTTCADVSGNTVTCTSPNTYTIALTANTTQATAFMKAVSISSVAVNASAQITRQTSGLEVALVLDNTGSMGDSVDGYSVSTNHPAKITALKCALAGDASFTPTGNTTCETNHLVTSGLLNVLYGSNTSLPDLFIGVVPFSDMVNLNVTVAPGSAFVNNVTAGNQSSMGGCVDSRSYTTTSTTGAGITLPTGDVPITLDIGDDPPSGAYFTAFTSSGHGDCPDAHVQPMTTSRSTVTTALQGMSPQGSTMIQLGFAWGWRMLSPNWHGLWGSTPVYTYPDGITTSTLPLPYNTPQMLKVVVLMTDGVNTVDYSGTAYENNATYPNTTTKLDNLTKTVCDAMKTKGIIIYTVGFGSSSGINTSLLQYCATKNYTGDTSHYFLAPTNAQLTSAFQEIGQQLSNLRISQ